MSARKHGPTLLDPTVAEAAGKALLYAYQHTRGGLVVGDADTLFALGSAGLVEGVVVRRRGVAAGTGTGALSDTGRMVAELLADGRSDSIASAVAYIESGGTP